MHPSCYKIKSHHYYLFSPLRSGLFYSVRQQKLQKLHGCNRYPPSSSKRLTFPRISFILVPFHALLSLLALSFSFPAYLARSRRSVPSVPRSGEGIVLILSYVVAAIVSSLRSSAIPLTAAYVSNACRGDSLRTARQGGKDARMQRGSHQRRNYWELVFYGLCAGFLR